MTRTCPNCGIAFTPTHPRQGFCVPAHQLEFHRRNAARGQVAMPLAQAWRRGKHGRTNEAAWALAQLAKLLDAWNAEDAAAGRRPDLAVSRKMADGWAAADLL